MKRIVALLLGLLMVSAACMAMAETVTAKPGDQLSFDIYITNASGTEAKVGIKTNSSPVDFVKAVGGSVNDVVPPQAFNDFFDIVNDDGITISANGNTVSGTPTGPKNLVDGKIGTLTFEVTEDYEAGQTYTVEAYKKEGSVTVSGSITFVIEESTSGRIPGDVNDDGVVDGRDSVRLIKYLAQWEVTVNEANSDVTGDGIIDGRDSVRLIKYLAQWDVVLE